MITSEHYKILKLTAIVLGICTALCACRYYNENYYYMEYKNYVKNKKEAIVLMTNYEMGEDEDKVYDITGSMDEEIEDIHEAVLIVAFQQYLSYYGYDSCVYAIYEDGTLKSFTGNGRSFNKAYYDQYGYVLGKHRYNTSDCLERKVVATKQQISKSRYEYLLQNAEKLYDTNEDVRRYSDGGTAVYIYYKGKEYINVYLTEPHFRDDVEEFTINISKDIADASTVPGCIWNERMKENPEFEKEWERLKGEYKIEQI